MPLPGGATKDFGQEFADSLAKQGFMKGITPPAPAAQPKEDTISQDSGDNHLNSLQEAILMNTLKPGLAKNPITGFFGDAFDTVKDAVTNTPHLDDFIRGLGSHVKTSNGIPIGQGGDPVFDSNHKVVMERNRTTGKEIGSLFGSVADITNVAVAPVASLFKGAENIPIAGGLFKGFNWLIGKGLKVTNDMVNSYIDLLPISQEAKDDIGKPVADAVTALGAIAAGDAVHDRLPEIKAKLEDVHKAITKDIITTYNVPKTITVTPEQVRNFHESQGIQGGAAMTPEETQAFKDLGLSGRDYVDAIRNGTTINIPAEKVVSLVDKPYWAKVKQLFSNQFYNFDSIPESVTTPLGNVSQGPAGFLPEGKPEGEPILNTSAPEGIPQAPTPEQAIATSNPDILKAEPIPPLVNNEPGFVPMKEFNIKSERERLEAANNTIQEPTGADRGTSKIAQSVEAKSIEQGLTKGFGNLAGYDKVTVKDQADRAAELLNSNIDEARAVLRGEKELPSGLKGVSVIKAFEDYLLKNPDGSLAYELANSPLITGTSEAAQELRLASERDPDSVTAKLQDIRNAREKKGGAKLQRARTVSRKLVEASKEINLPKSDLDWENFLNNEVAC